MNNPFLKANNIKCTADFIKVCRSLEPKSFVELAKKTGQSRTNLYKIFEYFGLSNDEKQSILSGYVNGKVGEDELYKIAPKSLPKGGNFNSFPFMGVNFYVYKLHSKSEAYVLRMKRNKLDYVSELKLDHGDTFYFNDVDQNRKSVLKTVFMYCYYHKLSEVPEGLRVSMASAYGKWYDKGNLIAKPSANSVKEAHHSALEKAIKMTSSGDTNDALAYLKSYMKAVIDTREKNSKKLWD